jgi:SAM-dependent methyltransferase
VAHVTVGLTDERFWDEYWHAVRLPLEVDPSSSLVAAAIVEVFERFLATPEPLSLLELGGAPGQYSACLHRRLGHAVTILDNSPVGCEKARENFDLLGIPARVVEGDMFAPPAELGTFDAVFSLGLIEHFEDITQAVRAHVALVRPGGLLFLGVPNYRGFNEVVLRRLSPSFLAWHRLESMDPRAWDGFEEELRLTRLFRGYIGGFEASTFWRSESPNLFDRALHQVLWRLGKTLGRKETRALRRLNNGLWSAYLMGVYRVLVPGAQLQSPR